MGVPGFFSWLLKKLKIKKLNIEEIISKQCPIESIDTLYIDANCLFHPQCYKILYHHTDIHDVTKLENKMIKRILEYITFLIEYVNPKNVFISVDGPAPMAKLNQQRKRRYKTVQDNEIINKIKITHGLNPITIWSNCCITPGTIFMENLHQQLLCFCKNLHINCTYSSYHTEGEGEHKILQEIKRYNNNDANVIYGLDADLIFLSLASGKRNIYLLRESTELDKKHKVKNDPMDIKEDLNYVSIDNVKICINLIINDIIQGNRTVLENEYSNVWEQDGVDNNESNPNPNSNPNSNPNPNPNLNLTDYTNDFIIICYFIGNDFINNIPSIDIKNGGMDLLIKIYGKIHTSSGEFFYRNKKLNEKFLCNFIHELSKYEKYYFEIKYPQYKQKIDSHKCTSDDLYEIDIWNFENVQNIHMEDPIKLGQGDYNAWKNKYYTYYYSVCSQYDRTNLINQMCKNYIEGLHWITKYYFESCVSNVWQYNYYHSPFASDIWNYLKLNKNVNIKFKDNITIYPIVQLLAVIPPFYKSLLPVPYQKLMGFGSEILDLFPDHVKIDELYKHVQHKCIPYVPCIDIERIILATNNIKLNYLEEERNKLYNNFIYTK